MLVGVSGSFAPDERPLKQQDTTPVQDDLYDAEESNSQSDNQRSIEITLDTCSMEYHEVWRSKLLRHKNDGRTMVRRLEESSFNYDLT